MHVLQLVADQWGWQHGFVLGSASQSGGQHMKALPGPAAGMPWRDRRDRLRKQWKRNIALIERPAEFPVLMRFAVGTLVSDHPPKTRVCCYHFSWLQHPGAPGCAHQ